MRKIKQGSIIYLDFDPTLGHEQNGRRPALVVSNETYNSVCNLRFVCPISNTINKHPLHVDLDKRTKTTGTIKCEQLKAVDITKRNADYIEDLPNDLLDEVKDILIGIIEED